MFLITSETVRAAQRDMSQSQRQLEREIQALQKKEKELIAQVKKYAAQGNQVLCLFKGANSYRRVCANLWRYKLRNSDKHKKG